MSTTNAVAHGQNSGQKEVTNRLLAKIISLDFIGVFVLIVFTAGGTWATITYSQETQDEKIKLNEEKITKMAKSQDTEFKNVKNKLQDMQIQNATMKNEQKNQGRNIEQIVRMLERIEDRVE